MSLTIFLVLCIFGLDFMIYAFFQWIYGDKRGALARQLAALKNARKEQSPRPFLVGSQKAAASKGRVWKSNRFVNEKSSPASRTIHSFARLQWPIF
jgi:hypothetical protein